MKPKKVIGFEIKRVNNLIVRNIHARLAREGFDECTIMHGWILGYLYMHRDSKVCQKNLEDKFGIAKSTATNILKLMEKKGYIERTADEQDGRQKLITLTDAGRDMHFRTIEVIDRFHEDIEAGISPAEKEALYKIIDKIINNLDCKEEDND